MTTNDEILAELRALRAIVDSLAPLRAMVDALLPGKPLATAMECAGPYGDPVCRFDLKNMPPIKGKRMSQLPANQLDALASTMEFLGDKAKAENKTYNGKPEWPRSYLDAARARRWALRRRMGRKPEGESAPAATGLPGLGAQVGLGGIGDGLGLSAPPAPARGAELADDDDDFGFDDATDGDLETPF